MPSPSTEMSPRTYNSMMPAELTDEARKAVKAVFDAMSSWRADIVKSNEKNCEQIIDKMAGAAEALGWPEQIIDVSHAQLQAVTKMQVQTMDYMMDAWEEQIESPNPMTSTPSRRLSKLQTLSGFSPVGTWPNVGASQAAMNPMQFWMQLAEQWQKGLANAMAFWATAGKPNDGLGPRRH